MILEHYYPNEYLLLLIFSNVNKFKYFIENYCKKSFLLTDIQWLELIKYINKSKWKLENSVLKSFILSIKMSINCLHQKNLTKDCYISDTKIFLIHAHETTLTMSNRTSVFVQYSTTILFLSRSISKLL